MKYIIIDFKPDGSSVVTTQGYSGPACIKATAELTKILGPVESRRLTPEYNRKELANAQCAVHQTGR
jgi:hypothetical protein